MQAAFVDIGMNRAAFLYVGDVGGKSEKTRNLYVDNESDDDQKEQIVLDEPLVLEDEPRPLIQDLLHESQVLLVQVAKDPLGTKGARITTHISLPGRHIVFMPMYKEVGISRRIQNEDERERLKEIIEQLNPKGGVIIRTAGEGAEESDLKSDLEYLYRLWKEVEKNYEKKKSPGIVHAEMDIELRALRDMLSEKVDRVFVDSPKVFKKINSFIAQFMPKYKNKIKLYNDKRPLFDLYDIDLEISRS